MLEPIVLPKLLIYFADFPYLGCLWHWATHPWVLLQFGTTGPFLFTELVLCFSVSRSTDSLAGKFSPAPVQLSSLYCYPRAITWINACLPFPRIVSPPSIKRMNPTQCPNHNRYYFQDLLRESLHTQSPVSFSAIHVPVYQIPLQASHDRSPPSILVYPKFDRYVATRFLADSNLHGHRPTVITWPSTFLPVLSLVA